MAILSGFVREARVEEIAGCPLTPPEAGGDESSCAACPYNVLNPGHARLGCMVSTPKAVYERSMAHLALISSDDHAVLQQLLKAERETGMTSGLSPGAVARVHEIAEKWWPLVGNDQAERQVVTAILRFCDASLAQREPIKILA